jgi:hypothetical protein
MKKGMVTAAMTIAARIAARVRHPPALVILALNLVPAACVVLFGWSAGVLLLLYWTENVIIGGFNVAKMGLSGTAWGGAGMVMAAVTIPFFIFHYGLFCFVHGIFVLALGFGPEALGGDTLSPMGLYEFVTRMAREEPGFGRALAAILAAQSVSFIFDWLIPGGPRRFNPMVQMFAPYPRIIVLHLAIMAGAIPVLVLGSPVWAVVVLCLMKTFFDLHGDPVFLIDDKARRRADTSIKAMERLWRRSRKSAP